MVIHRSRDNLTSCNPELYDSIYSVNRRPDIKTTNTHPAIPKDTIERSASTEAMNRLQRPSENMIMEPNVLFRRIGKYLFLSVAMPPYFLLYGLPKWLLVEGFQVVTVALTWLKNELTEKTRNPIKLIFQKISQLTFFIQMLLKSTIKPVAELAIQLRQFFQRLAYRFVQVNYNIYSKFKETLKKPLKLLKKFTESAKNLSANISNLVVEAKRWVRDKALRFNEKVEQTVNIFKQSPQLIVQWGNNGIEYLRALQSGWTKKISSKFHISSKAALSCTEWVGRQIGFLSKVVKSGLSPISFFYQNIISPVFQAIARTFRSCMNKFSGFLNDRRRRFLEFLEKIQVKIKFLTPQIALDKILPTSFLAKLPAILGKFLLKIKESSIIHALFDMGLKSLTFFVVNLSQVLKKIVEGAASFSEKIAGQFKLLKERISSSSKETVNKIKKSADLIQKGSKNGLHGTLVIVFMMGILLSWGFESLGEMTTRWISKVSFFNRKT